MFYERQQKADIRLDLITGHMAWKKRTVNPSRPGALSAESDLIVFHTSSSMKWSTSPSRCTHGRSKASRLIVLACSGGVPNTVAKKSHNADASASSDTNC
jgi:hypothetical protein